MKRRKMVFLWLAVLLLCGCGKNTEYVEPAADIADSFPLAAKVEPENPQLVTSDGPYAILHTTAGDITILLYPKQAPKAVENFITLAKEGYYDGTLFHYAKRDDLTQTGLPGDLTKAERSIWEEPFEDEVDRGLYHFPGAVGMAGQGNDMNLSQFYLLVKDVMPEDERLVPATMYMNDLIRLRTEELNERNQLLTEEELAQFEADLNTEIQAINSEGVPREYLEEHEAVFAQYDKFGGAWSLDRKYTVFGQIVEGLNVAQAITRVKVDAETRKPLKDVVIHRIEIRE